MADLFQSHYDLGSLRRGVQDGETLWALLGEDGTIAIVPDPDPGATEAAAQKLSKLDLEDPEVANDPETKALIRTSAFQAPPSAAPIEVEEEEEKPVAKAEAK